jgi:hypothetical protein
LRNRGRRERERRGDEDDENDDDQSEVFRRLNKGRGEDSLFFVKGVGLNQSV